MITKRDVWMIMISSFLFGIVVGVLILTALLVLSAPPPVRAIVDLSSLSTHEAGHGFSSPNTSPGGRARHRGLTYLSIGCPGRWAPNGSPANSFREVMGSGKQYGGSSPLTLPIDREFLTSSSRPGRTAAAEIFPSTADASCAPAANRCTHILPINKKHGRPVEFEHPTPAMAVSAGAGF